MAIAFDAIPANLRTPGSYVEFNNELGGSFSPSFTMLAIGQRLTTGTVNAGEPVRMTAISQAEEFWGRGSMLANMAATMLLANRDIELWGIALDDNPAGTAATGTFTVTGTATASGTLSIHVGGQLLQIGVASGDDAAIVAANIAAAINSRTDLPLTAASAAAVVTVTARHAGELGNEIDLRTYLEGDVIVNLGVSIAASVMSGGAGNPDITPVITAMGDNWYNWIAMPFTDATNLQAFEAELLDRWGPLRQIGGRAFSAYRGSYAATATFGSGRNSHLVCMLGIGASPTAPWIAAADACATAAKALAIDPARPSQTLILRSVKAPIASERLTRAERNLLLYDGISTYTVDAGGLVRIERLITMYQLNAFGLDDSSYLDLNTLETLERLRWEQRAHFASRYPRHKLADDGTRFGAGQPIVTPAIFRGELLALYRDFEARGWVEDYEGYRQSLIVERDADRSRMNYRDVPNLINQLRVVAGKTQFKN